MSYLIIDNETILCSQFSGKPLLNTPVITSVSNNEAENNIDDKDSELKDKTKDGFIEKPFRMISEAVFFQDVAETIPVDYTTPGVLKNSMSIFPETLSIFKDHVPSVDYLLGYALDFQYIENTDPRGIDSLYRIDAQAEPKIARHVQTGAANRTSLTLLVNFSKSHKDMKWKDFLDNLGKNVNNQLVRFVAQKIRRYYEVSLVWTGADPNAMAHKLQHYANKLPKQFSIKKEVKKMDEDSIFQIVKEVLGQECGTEDQARKILNKLKKEKENLENQVDSLNTQVESLTAVKESYDKALQAKRDEVVSLQKLCTGNEKIDALTQQVIDQADYESLEKMHKSLTEKAEKTVQFKCSKCGSTNVTRLSSMEQSLTPGDDNPTPKPKPRQKITYGGDA